MAAPPWCKSRRAKRCLDAFGSQGVRHGHGSTDESTTPDIWPLREQGTWQTPVRPNDTTRTYFEKLATISPHAGYTRAIGVCSIRARRHHGRHAHWLSSELAPVLRTSSRRQCWAAGVAPNVIPLTAEATRSISVPSRTKMRPGLSQGDGQSHQRSKCGDVPLPPDLPPRRLVHRVSRRRDRACCLRGASDDPAEHAHCGHRGVPSREGDAIHMSVPP